MAAVSAKYRKYLRKAWHCVTRRITFRPCDISFKQEIKGRLLAKVAVKNPKMVRSASIGLEIAAFLVIVVTVWSLYVVVKSGLNLYVYGTCNPSNAASCSLGAEACSIEGAQLGFVDSVTSFKLHTYIANEFAGLGKTVAAVPSRMQTWSSEEYLPANVTYVNGYDKNKPTALEVVDPGCIYCQQLMRNIVASGFAERYNLAYIAYPIPSSTGQSGYKFPNSHLVVSYLEAMRMRPLDSTKRPVDWLILERMYTGSDQKGRSYQVVINGILGRDQTAELLQSWMREFGYNDKQVAEIVQLAASDRVAAVMRANEQIIKNQIKTVKIPTIIFDGRRHDGVVKTEDLR
ncbi:MAG: hypothetical protein WBP26_01150 [Candidatus Saccharimonadales bacterium]